MFVRLKRIADIPVNGKIKIKTKVPVIITSPEHFTRGLYKHSRSGKKFLNINIKRQKQMLFLVNDMIAYQKTQKHLSINY